MTGNNMDNFTDDASPKAGVPTGDGGVEVSPELAHAQKRAWEWICDIIEKEAEFWVDDRRTVHINNGPAIAHKIVTDPVVLQLMSHLIPSASGQRPLTPLE